MQLKLRPLAGEDLNIVPLWTSKWMESRNPAVYPLTTFSCQGYSAYLAVRHTLPDQASPNKLLGAYQGTVPVGFIEYSIGNDTLFINNLCIKEVMRGAGIGDFLLKDAILRAEYHQLSSVSLDCFLWNETAYGYYRRRGFRILSTSFWYTGENPGDESGEEAAFTVEDYPAAEACQQAYGFSNLRIITGGRTFYVGRLGDGYFRLVLAEEELDHRLLQILARIDRNRFLFVISLEPRLPKEDFLTPVSCSVRMELKLNR